MEISLRSISTLFVGACLLVASALSVLSPNFVWFFVDGPSKNVPQEILLPGLATIGVLLSLSARLWIGALLLVPWAILAAFESYYILDFAKPSDAHLLGIIGDTNLAEASDFLSGIVGLLVALGVFCGLLAMAAVYSAFRQKWLWQGRLRYWVLFASLFAICLPEIVKINGPSRAIKIPNAIAARPLGADLADDHHPEMFDYLLPVYPAGFPGRLYTYFRQRQALDNAKNLLVNFSFGASQISVGEQKQIYVLVIGESGRPDHWQLNGYRRETTPRLMQVERLLSFRDAFSPWAWTRMAVPLILTRKSALDNNQFFSERSLISAFREAGFRTYWFSTQSPLGPHDSSIALHAAEAHETKFLNPLDYKSAGVLDGALLAPLDDVLRRNEQKVLIVLHTLGSHFNYADRYSEDFEYFKPSLKEVKGASLHKPVFKEEFNNSYDNSVRYLDYFISEVIRRLDKTESIASMFYFADHGENLFDGNCDMAGHGRGNEYDFRVPALWWSSLQYENKYPDKVLSARAKVNSRISTTQVFHSMLDGANIHYSGENLALSFFSRSWQPSSRITQNKIDFDFSARDNICKKIIPIP